MSNIVIIAYICLMTPIVLMLYFIDPKSRTVYGYMMIGITIALLSSQVNSFLLQLTGNHYFDTTVNYTPICEEILKAIPVLFYAFAVNDKREDIVSVSFAVGVGFALLENLSIMMQTGSSAEYLWVFSRGIGAGLMHSICTCMVGLGISYVRFRRKLFVCGTLALLFFAILFHSIFNTLVQTDNLKYIGIALPVVSYTPLAVGYFKGRKDATAVKKAVR